MTEHLVYIIVKAQESDRRDLVVQMSGGGALISFRKQDKAHKVIGGLRDLADELERSIADRAAEHPLQATDETDA
jgi:hypothetical protein